METLVFENKQQKAESKKKKMQVWNSTSSPYIDITSVFFGEFLHSPHVWTL